MHPQAQRSLRCGFHYRDPGWHPAAQAPGTTSPLTGDTRARCPRHQPLPRASSPLPGPGDTGDMGGSLPCHGASPSSPGTGTHRDWHPLGLVCCVLCPQNLGEAAQFSACTGSTGIQKGVGTPSLAHCAGGRLCASVSLSVIDPRTQGVKPQPRLRDGQAESCQGTPILGGVTDSCPAPTTWRAAKTPGAGAARPPVPCTHAMPCTPTPAAPGMHPTCTQAHARAVTTLTCTLGPHRRNPRHPARLPPPAQPQPPPHARVTSVHPPQLPPCPAARAQTHRRRTAGGSAPARSPASA